MDSTQYRTTVFEGYSGRLLIALSLGWLAIQIGRNALPPLLPAMLAEFSISPFAGGVGLTLMWAFYALCHYPGGRLSDTNSRKPILILGLVILVGGFLLLSVARGYLSFLTALSLVGIGSGLYFIAMRANLADLFADHRGQAFGVQSAAGNFGSVSAGGLAAVILSLAVWELTLVPAVLLSCVALFAVHRWSTESYSLLETELALTSTFRRVFEAEETRVLLLVYSLFVFAWQGMAGFLPTYLQVSKSLTPAKASLAYAGVFAVGVVVMPLSGAVSDRLNRLWVAAGALFVCCLGFTSLLLVHSETLIYSALGLFAAGMMSYPPVMQAYLTDSFESKSVGGDFGAFKTVYSGVGSLGPAYVGLVASYFTYTAAYVGLACCLLGGVFLLTWLAAHG
ncbi:MFS transporter [Halogeometricum rufum]|uniref:MFS transporter n=1 Tax=Halogeometricum rufum TaxID=553469 RepID=UPI000B7DE13A|nr:MFS transporter [Halogeometricum rufum]